MYLLLTIRLQTPSSGILLDLTVSDASNPILIKMKDLRSLMRCASWKERKTHIREVQLIFANKIVKNCSGLGQV